MALISVSLRRGSHDIQDTRDNKRRGDNGAFNTERTRWSALQVCPTGVLHGSFRFQRAIFNGKITMWWTCRDSNSGPPACKADALPTELQAHIDVTNVTTEYVPETRGKAKGLVHFFCTWLRHPSLANTALCTLPTTSPHLLYASHSISYRNLTFMRSA